MTGPVSPGCASEGGSLSLSSCSVSSAKSCSSASFQALRAAASSSGVMSVVLRCLQESSSSAKINRGVFHNASVTVATDCFRASARTRRAHPRSQFFRTCGGHAVMPMVRRSSAGTMMNFWASCSRTSELRPFNCSASVKVILHSWPWLQ